MAEKRQFVLKLVVLGDAAVGKTSLINQYIEHSFQEDYKPTLGVNILTKEISLDNGDVVRLILWDLAAQAKYELSRTLFFQGCSGALFVYDVTRQDTFSNLETKWYKDYLNYSLTEKKGSYILIGNKIDLVKSRIISTKKGEELAKILGASEYLETSAKKGDNVEKTFKKLVYHVLKSKGIDE